MKHLEGEGMRFDLVRPCENCPFSTNENRIRFATRSRAEDIAEHAYRNGFPCHQHAENVEDDEGESSGYYFRQDGTTQHCFGALLVFARHGDGPLPFLRACDEDETLEQRWWDRVPDASLRQVFEDEDAFLEANDAND